MITGGAFAAMLIISLAAALRLPKRAQVPMQWGIRGRPTWTAPVWAAVVFTPALALIVCAGTFFLVSNSQRAVVDALVPSLAVAFLIVHAAHLFFATRRFASERD